MGIQKFDYEGTPISFEFQDGNKMINATEMIKSFPSKRINNFLRTQQTKDYIILLESRYAKKRNGENRAVLRIVQGGTPELQGTWMDEKLALKFAAWLSTDFELWIFDRIEELLKTGKTELPTNRPPSNIFAAIRMIVDKLEYQERDINELKEGLQEVKEYVGDLEAKITAIDENYYSVSGYCALHNIDCPLPKAQAWGRTASAKSRAMGYEVGKAFSTIYGEVGSYHRKVLEEVFKGLK